MFLEGGDCTAFGGRETVLPLEGNFCLWRETVLFLERECTVSGGRLYCFWREGDCTASGGRETVWHLEGDCTASGGRETVLHLEGDCTASVGRLYCIWREETVLHLEGDCFLREGDCTASGGSSFQSDSCQPFLISSDLSDFNIKCRFSDFHCYFLLFEKLMPKKEKGTKSHVLTNFQSKFSQPDVVISSVALLAGEVSRCLH